jgi:hypothetical protein
MLNQGAGVASEEAKLKAKNEIMLILINLINDLPNVAQEYEYVGFTGQKKIGSI